MTTQNKEKQSEKRPAAPIQEVWRSELHLALQDGTIVVCDNGRFVLTINGNDVSGDHFDDPTAPAQSHPVAGKIREILGFRFIRLNHDVTGGQRHRGVLTYGTGGGPDRFFGTWMGVLPNRCRVRGRRFEDQGEAIWVGTKG